VQAQVRAIAAALLERCERLDVLVNTAGLVNLRRSVTPDGIETTFAVNHLACFLLTGLLLERLRATPGARIVNVASDAHRFVRGMNWDDLGHERRYRAMRVYGHSKLANLLFTLELARRLEGSGATANSVHPGAVGTGLATNNGALGRVVMALLRPFFRTPERGAETAIWLASAPELGGVTGGYFFDRRAHQSSPAARDPAAARRLWEVSAKLTGLDA
jgi:NAD(P)-dependent dehydrogenase (short-subunit alcohol dehydrogenase family)